MIEQRKGIETDEKGVGVEKEEEGRAKEDVDEDVEH